jgi:hypothetical protein
MEVIEKLKEALKTLPGGQEILNNFDDSLAG